MTPELEKQLKRIKFFSLAQTDHEVNKVLTDLGEDKSIHSECVEWIRERSWKGRRSRR